MQHLMQNTKKYVILNMIGVSNNMNGGGDS